MVPMITDVYEEKKDFFVIRFCFQKRGAIAYVSHLDLLRTFNKALLRAALPLYYTEGFSPKPKLVFATPLSVGQESLCEYLDVRLIAPVDFSEAARALRENLPPELCLCGVGAPSAKFSSIAYSDYEITIKTAGADEALAKRIEEVLLQKPLIVFKRSKAGDRDTDISGGIRTLSVSYEAGSIRIFATLAADSAGFLNPDYLIGALRRDCGILSTDPLWESVRILRVGLRDAEGQPLTVGRELSL